MSEPPVLTGTHGTVDLVQRLPTKTWAASPPTSSTSRPSADQRSRHPRVRAGHLRVHGELLAVIGGVGLGAIGGQPARDSFQKSRRFSIWSDVRRKWVEVSKSPPTIFLFTSGNGFGRSHGAASLRRGTASVENRLAQILSIFSRRIMPIFQTGCSTIRWSQV